MALILAGMHRSGTSLVASWLQECGVSMSEGRTVQAIAGNDRGLFEDRDFVALNQRAILRSHPESRGWAVTEGSCRLSVRDVVRVRRQVRQRRYHDVWGFKDPRACLLLGSYRWAMPTMSVLVVRRPRDDVVDSLVRRSAQLPEGSIGRTTEAEAGAVFDHYERRLTAFVSARPSRCVDVGLGDVLADDRAVFEQLERLVGGGMRYAPIRDLFDADLLGR